MERIKRSIIESILTRGRGFLGGRNDRGLNDSRDPAGESSFQAFVLRNAGNPAMKIRILPCYFQFLFAR